MKNHVGLKRGRELDVSVVSVRSAFCPRRHLLHCAAGPRSSDQPGVAATSQLDSQDQSRQILASIYRVYLSMNLSAIGEGGEGHVWLVLRVGQTVAFRAFSYQVGLKAKSFYKNSIDKEL